MSKNAEESIFQEILEYRCPRYEQFPAIPLITTKWSSF